MVVSPRGIVATTQYLASQAGAQILARGGSAVDAAIAANAVLSVLEPGAAGPGGDLFAIYRDARTGQLSGLNASGWAPSGLTIDFLKSKGMERMPIKGIYSVTVPGCVDGWEKLHRRFGKLPWQELFAPAIYLASNGFPVSHFVSWHWNQPLKNACTDEPCRRVFFRNGHGPEEGGFYRNAEFAGALKVIAEQGASAFYKGPIADAILRSSDRLGGTMNRADLESFSAEWVTPVSTTYRGWTVYELPPNSRGVAVLEMLNILSNVPAEVMSANNASAIHYRIEAMRLGYADIDFLADPRLQKVPTATLLSQEYARNRAAAIDPERADCSIRPGKAAMLEGDTTYLTVVDRDGNIVSLIQSLASSTSGVVVDGMGFLMQDRGRYFSLDPAQPNALAPRKRPSHTLIPALIEKGDTHIGLGFVGGVFQAMAQMQAISNIIDRGMDIQAALEAPRFIKTDPGPNCRITVESRMALPIRDGLARMGNRIEVDREYGDMGVGQAVMFDSKTGTKFGASDPRGDGGAIPEPLPW
jgi:gamma-glutamyltranspeptidase/glutathione hydrolase